MLSNIKPLLLAYVRTRCVFKPLKIMVKPGYCSFKVALTHGIKHSIARIEYVHGCVPLGNKHYFHTNIVSLFYSSNMAAADTLYRGHLQSSTRTICLQIIALFRLGANPSDVWRSKRRRTDQSMKAKLKFMAVGLISKNSAKNTAAFTD